MHDHLLTFPLLFLLWVLLALFSSASGRLLHFSWRDTPLWLDLDLDFEPEGFLIPFLPIFPFSLDVVIFSLDTIDLEREQQEEGRNELSDKLCDKLTDLFLLTSLLFFSLFSFNNYLLFSFFWLLLLLLLFSCFFLHFYSFLDFCVLPDRVLLCESLRIVDSSCFEDWSCSLNWLRGSAVTSTSYLLIVLI